jgi:hypothetical protein
MTVDALDPLPRKRRRRSLKPYDWIVCMLVPPLGILLGTWSLARGNAVYGSRRILVSFLGIAILAAIYFLLQFAAAIPPLEQ